MKPIVLSIVGPTASGKTSLAVSLAKQLHGEILSCDSMQIYRDMEIGTAAPTPAEQQGIPHFGIGICAPDVSFSAADWTAYAADRVAEILARGHLPVFCGGTGLYLDSLLQLSAFSPAVQDDALRASLQKSVDAEGAAALHARLAALDPEAAHLIHPNNVKRVIRALEICMTTGMTKTEWDRRQKQTETRYAECRFVLSFHNRALLYARIDRRVTQMLENGLVEETKRLIANYPRATTAMQAIGYKELLPYLDGLCTLPEAADAIRQATRNYAKRQLTWFRRGGGYPLYMDTPDGLLRSADDVLQEAETAYQAWLQTKSI